MKFKILGYTFIILVFAATVGLLYYQNVKNEQSQSYLIPVHKEDQVYTNNQYAYQFTYPAEDVIQDNRVYLPDGAYPSTTFNEAWMQVAATENLSATQCSNHLKADPLNKLTGKQTVNGVEYNTASSIGAAAGNLYENKTYNTYQNNICYEISLNLHTSNLDNYPVGTVSAVDKNAVWASLDKVFQTLKFTN